MDKDTKSGVTGAVLVGLGCGLAAAGVALLVPVWTNWSLGLAGQALRKGREQVEDAAAMFGEVAGRAQQRFGEAARAAKQTTSRAAGAVETAARTVREYTAECSD